MDLPVENIECAEARGNVFVYQSIVSHSVNICRNINLISLLSATPHSILPQSWLTSFRCGFASWLLVAIPTTDQFVATLAVASKNLIAFRQEISRSHPKPH
jgi:hypothetical protein